MDTLDGSGRRLHNNGASVAPAAITREPDCVSLKFCTMENPFKTGDKVMTKFMGAEVEVPVAQIYDDEVQVRTSDGVLRWRTKRTVWFPPEKANEALIRPAPEPVPSPAEVLPVEPSPQKEEPPIVVTPAVEEPMIATCGHEEAEELKRSKSKGKKRSKRKWF